MDRNKKIQLLKDLISGVSFIEALIPTHASIPSWIVNEFATIAELQVQQCKIHKCKGRIIKKDTRYYFIPLKPVPIKKGNWFEYEAQTTKQPD